MKKKEYYKGVCDMNTGRDLENGHIVAVRYVWNSYVGEVNYKFGGLCATGARRHAFWSPHSLKPESTYQILGHVDKEHPDYNQDILDWYKSEDENTKCPLEITVYKNCENE
jgi:hypothetical protein